MNAANYFVDYLGGADSNAGTSTSLPWQHCPGDPAASGVANALTLLPGDTVRFKGGVTYVLTGSTGIVLSTDGVQGNVITFDGNSAGTWGTGRALITDKNGGKGINAFSASSRRRYLAFKSLEFFGIGGASTLPPDLGVAEAPRFGGGIRLSGGAEFLTVDDCVFRDLGYTFTKKPMKAESISGAGISVAGGQTIVISNCQFSGVALGCDFSSSAQLSGVEITKCTFAETIVWPINLPTSAGVNVSTLVSARDSTFSTSVFAPTVWTGYGVDPRTEVIAVNAGSAVTLGAAALASPAATFQWLKNGITIPGATGETLPFFNVSSGDVGTYTVIATNVAGSATSNTAQLIVDGTTPGSTTPDTTTTNPNIFAAPTITTQPVSQTGVLQGTAAFTAAATGNPAPMYQWLKDGQPISGATAAVLNLTGLTLADAGTYSLVAKNSVGAVTTNTAELILSAAPVFVVQPVDRVADALTSVVFKAAASGTPTPTYQWLKNGAPISGATSTVLVLDSVSSNDAGSYSLVAKNSAGAATSVAAQLTVAATLTTPTSPPPATTPTSVPPVITQQPVAQSATTLATVTFAAAATGTPAPTFQWLKNGVALSGATNASLSLQSVTTNDAARYSVVATNSAGTVISDEALLSVSEVVDNPTSSGGVTFSPIASMQRIDTSGGTTTAAFTIPGTTAKKILVRAAGPSLAKFTTGVLDDPLLAVFQNGVGAAKNDNWGGSSTLIDAFNQVGAFPFVSPDSKDSALLVTLAPGDYTATVFGLGGSTGSVLIEVFEVR